MKNKKIFIKIGIILLVLFTNYLLFKVILQKSINLVDVYVASNTLGPRIQISEKDIKVVRIPKAYVQENTVLDPKEIIGKFTEIQGMIPKGSMFYAEMLFAQEMLPDYPATKLRQGQVAFSLPTDLVKLSGNTLVSGQSVNLFVTVPIRNDKPVVDCLVSNVRIISIKDRNGIEMGMKESANVPYVVILAVDEKIVSDLSSAFKMGSIDLYAPSLLEVSKEESVFHEDSKVLPFIRHEQN